MADKFLPQRDRKYLEDKKIQYREMNDGARNGLIIDNFVIGQNGKFNIEETSLLIFIPPGYPDVPPDMLYFSPDVLYKDGNRFPPNADVKENHFNQIWQRWSRHNHGDSWRPGIDGIHSCLQKVYTALKQC